MKALLRNLGLGRDGVIGATCLLLLTVSALRAAELKLPDPLVTREGRKVESRGDWNATRRPEVLELFRENVYGRAPIGRPDKLSFETTQCSPDAMGGKATRKLVNITYRGPGGEGTIRLVLFIPNAAARPAPSFLLICNRGPENIDPSRKVKSPFWPAEQIVARGYAAAAFYNADVALDKYDRFTSGVFKVFDPPAGRRVDSWGTIAAWAWGASRVMDYLETDRDINAKRVAVVGHSRGGKTALWAGAEDERFAMVVSNESGSTGAALARNKQGEHIRDINQRFPHWFCENYKRFNDREDQLPVDQHMLAALIAPRLLYIASASEDLWSDPHNEFLAVVHAGPVYRLLGLKDLGTTVMPKPEAPVQQGSIAYHLRTGKHNLTEYDWGQFMDFADQHHWRAPTPPPRSARDGTVMVETHGNSPEAAGPWQPQPSRLLELVEGYRAAGDRVKLDPYGGWADGPCARATGFFYVTKSEGRRWLIDPQGHRFFHIAMDTVREPKYVNANYGSATAWAEAVTALLRTNGFNGLGNGASTRLQKTQQPLVWVLRKDFLSAFARAKKVTEPAAGTQGFINRCMPVFLPDFEEFCDQYGKDLAATANDPSLLGIMTDNEIQCPVKLLDRYLSLDPANPNLKPGRDAAAAWLCARKGPAAPSDLSQLTHNDRYEFIAYAFERYYRIVSRTVRKYDPNHLYLGSRINYRAGQFDNPWFWKMLAAYHDAVSVNYYGAWGPQPEEFAHWEAWAGKPILLTEWYAKAEDVPGLANTKGGGWLVRTQEDRARYYQHFVLSALELKNVIGYHWFKYLDDPRESVALDSAGGANKGMFDLQGKPYLPLLDRARAINREVYPLIEFFDARNM